MTELRLSTKIFFGIGQAAEGMKNSAFGVFLLLFYNQILGLSPLLAGLALMLALVSDAITDPVTGSISDAWRGRFGRRHGFMYAAALPMALTFYCVFSPPSGLSQGQLFAWMTVWVVLARAAMTLYHVPHLALGAELSEDYVERTRIVAYRTFFQYVGVGALLITARVVFMAPTEAYPDGQLNPAAYPALGLWFGAAMAVLIIVSAIGTHSRIPYLPKAPEKREPLSAASIFSEVGEALSLRSFRVFFAGILLFFIARGVDSALNIYMGTFFWKLGSDAVSLQIAGLFGILVGSPLFAVMAKRMEKHKMFMRGIIGFSLFTMAPPIFALVGAFPAHESSAYIPTLYGAAFLAAIFGAASIVSAGSMLADLADEHELSTGRRQEGIFFGALSFSGKASSGFGQLVSGIALWAIQFPTEAAVGEVADNVVNRLALVYGPGVLLLVILAIVILGRYDLTRARHSEIRSTLEQRRSEGASADPSSTSDAIAATRPAVLRHS